MDGSPFEAIAYIKAEPPGGGLPPGVALNIDDSPVLKQVGGGLQVAYLVDEGDRFAYVQGRHLRAMGLDADALHARALGNLSKLADGKVSIRQNGPIWALFLDGNFEASLILLDEIWEGALEDYTLGDPVVAVPARDVLCFCDSSSPPGIAELRAVIKRVWPDGDHLISDRLFRRQGRRWIPFDDFS